MNRQERLKLLRSWITRIGVFLGVWILFVLFINYIAMPVYIRNWREITVPDLRGMSQEQAAEVAKNKNVKIFVQDEQFLAGVEEGIILDQFPLPGLEAKPGRRVHVIVAAGAPTTKVPYVVGLSREEAMTRMDASGLVVDSIYYAFSDSVFESQVMRQMPDSGLVLRRESPVEMTVSLGKKPRRVIVPDVLDLPYEQARYLILKAGLSIGTVKYDRYIGRKKGAVMNQDPPPRLVKERRFPVQLEVNYPEGWAKPVITPVDSLVEDT